MWLNVIALLTLSGYSGVVSPRSDPQLAQAIGAKLDINADHRFPACEMVINVTKAPYFAKGDGQTDDTKAIQQALNDMMGRHKILYLPNGTYLISRTLSWTNKNTAGNNAWGFNWIQGQNPLKTIIRLQDQTFTDPTKAQPMMWCGGFGSADWFNNFVENLTFSGGRGNPGAVGLQFYSNNMGAVRDVLITSDDGLGSTGLDLAHRDMNGPILVKNVVVRGFGTGIRTGQSVNSQTFEDVSVQGQSEFGFDNHGQSIAIRHLMSENAVPALRTYGTLSLIDSRLVGIGESRSRPGVINYNGGRIGLRDVETVNYGRAVADLITPDYVVAYRLTGPDKPGSFGPKIGEYFSHTPTIPFGGPSASLRLPVEETPRETWEDPKSWAVVDKFGADPTGGGDSSDAIQRAIDSGAKTIFFPGFYSQSKSVIIRGKVRRLIGSGAWLDMQRKAKPSFIVEGGSAPMVTIEHFSNIGSIEIRTSRPVVLRSLGTAIKRTGPGKLFLEDVGTDDLRMTPGQPLFARQLNIENEGTHLTNSGAKAWILGYKTERGGTLVHTTSGGQTELFGTFSYTTTAGKLAPMFITEDSSVFAFFNEVCYSGDPFETLIRETRQGVTKIFKRSEATMTPYIGRPANPK